jgi:hypothetical protein
MHTALVSRLMKDRSAWELAHVPMAAPASEDHEAAAMRNEVLTSPALMGA